MQFDTRHALCSLVLAAIYAYYLIVPADAEDQGLPAATSVLGLARLADNPRDRATDGVLQLCVPDGSQDNPVDDASSARSEEEPSTPPEPEYRANLSFKARAASLQALIAATARAEGIQPELLHAVVAAESSYNPLARSPKGALGLMQLMPGTALRYAITDLHDPAQNLTAGARHLRYLLSEFDNDLQLTLAAYNAGEYAVRRHGNSVPPYPETRAYVARVLAYYTDRLPKQDQNPL
jgi:soluble lytic murein transglycosylase-like protein